MRRSSVVGPILLIAIGALFLARNVFPELPLLDYLARYWPFVLIAWGVLRLVEIVMWTASDKPLPKRGIAGPEWALVILLCFIGASLHAVRGVADWLPNSRFAIGGLDVFGESHDYPFAGEKPASKAPRVIIDGFRGNARITGADVATVAVVGHNTIRSLDKATADSANQRAHLELVGEGDQITVRLNQDQASAGQRVTADLEITVPKGSSIEAHGRTGDFDINGINGEVSVESNNAGVRLDNIGGAVRLDVRNSDMVRAANVKGSVELKGRGNDVDFQNIEGAVSVNGSFSGIGQFQAIAKPVRFVNPFMEFSAERVPGYLRLSIGDVDGSNIVGPVRISSTRSKDVRLSDFTESLDINLNRGDVDLRPGARIPKMNIKVRQGDVELALPAGAKFDMKASSLHGELNDDYGSPIQYRQERRGGSLIGGNGGPAIEIETNQGDLRIRKAAADEPLRPKDKGPGAPPVLPDLPKVPVPPPQPINQ